VRVNQAVAREVAEVFLAAPRAAPDRTVRAAYRQLEEQSDAALARVTRGHHIRVVFTRCPLPYASDRELIRAVRADRVLEVTTAASEPDRRHPMMGCERGGAYDRFRALHDLTGHVFPGFGFDRDGEFSAWLVQDQLYTGLARWALATELHAEHSVRWTTGQFCEHKAVLHDRELVACARRGAPTAA
jgi:hypothetical protein